MREQLIQLEAVLLAQVDAHRKLGARVRDRLAAMRRADLPSVTKLVQDEGHQVQVVAELEKQRALLAADLTLKVDPAAPRPMRLDELAMRLPDPWKQRLLTLRASLRQEMTRVRSESQITRDACEALMRHMQGMMRTVAAAMNGVALYGRNGAPPDRAMAVSTFEARA